MSGGISVIEAHAGPQQRPPVGGSTARSAAADAAASFDKAIDEALQDATRMGGTGDATAEKPADEVEETKAPEAPGGEPASATTAGQPAETPAVAGPQTPHEKPSLVEAGFMVRGNPVAQLLARIVVTGLAAAPEEAEASPPAAASVEPGPAATRRPAAGGAHPVVAVGERFDAGAGAAPAVAAPAVGAAAAHPVGRVAERFDAGAGGAGGAGAAREPFPVAVVASATYPLPAQPAPVQLAAALAGEIGAVPDPGPLSSTRPQPPARLLTIALDPPELGSVLVRLKLTGRGLEVAIAAQPQAVSAVREGLGEIARALHGQGVPVEALNVRVADWRDLAAGLPAAPRADTAAASAQASPQSAGGTEVGWSGRDGGDGRGERRDAPGDGAAHRPREQREGRESNGGENEAAGRAGAGGGRYV